MITPIAEDIFGQATSCDFHLPSEAGANVLALCDMTPLQEFCDFGDFVEDVSLPDRVELRDASDQTTSSSSPSSPGSNGTLVWSARSGPEVHAKKEKRRKQNRMSQAAFRQRKEQELTALRNQVKELLAERQGLLDLHARTVMAIDHMKRIVLGLDCGTLVPKSDLPSILKHDSNAWEPHRQ
ncbi:hypothetical protein PV05_08578 [Exophiala xenobiotica]|uniref:BZIP domain-containing protein n=1 Tax=Exophiala xenobiotica TaxID=348802 RepID=A0A0D2BKG2_9EURO|nr:uncharacterized protein PV05_08578 [Exophiala xenobiotica]KIW52971.1 hypothetical protein PV05_08578 [Exophiala xenobiotica]